MDYESDGYFREIRWLHGDEIEPPLGLAEDGIEAEDVESRHHPKEIEMTNDVDDEFYETIQLIEPHEPTTAAVLSAQYARYCASSVSPANAADLRDICMTLSDTIRRYNVVDRGATTDQLVNGLLGLVDKIEKRFGLKPAREKQN
jgi:hypothetical protein